MRRLSTLTMFALLAAATPAAAADEIHWTHTGPTSVTFDWRGPDSTLAYGASPTYDSIVTASPPVPLPFSSAGPFWEAKLTGLLPGTSYHYSVGGGPDHEFHTPPPAPATFTVFVEGDVGDTAKFARVGPVQALIAGGAPDLVLVTGDLTYADDNGQACVDDHFNNVMKWSQDTAYMPAWGNHDWSNADTLDDLRNYKGRFDLPNPQTSPGAPAAGCCGEDWCWFDYGQVRFISYPEPYHYAAWADWFAKALPLMDEAQSNPAIRYIVTFGHRPAYSSGYHPGDATLRGYLDSLGTTHGKYVLNLNAHSHGYERSFPQHGVTHITVGIGGASLEEMAGACPWSSCPPPDWSAFRAFHHGALRLVFAPGSIRGDAICGPAGDAGSNRNDIQCDFGRPFDSFVIGEALLIRRPPRRFAGRFGLELARALPSARAIEIEYMLAAGDAARLELVDVAGRVMMRRDLGEPGAGSHRTTLEVGGRTPSGIYLVRLTESGRSATAKVALLR